MTPRRLGLRVVGVLLALGGNILLTGPAGACFERLHFSEPRSGALLLAVPLEPGDPRFVLAYEHSVHLSTVYSGYRATDGEIVQHWERYRQPGYGMAARPKSGGESIRHEDGVLRARMSRRFARIVMRVQADRSNRMVVPRSIDLSQRWGDRAVAMTVTNRCHQSDESTDGN